VQRVFRFFGSGGVAFVQRGHRSDQESSFRLFGDLESVVDLDSQLPHGTLELAVPQIRSSRSGLNSAPKGGRVPRRLPRRVCQ
jgi:hypothetical protein